MILVEDLDLKKLLQWMKDNLDKDLGPEKAKAFLVNSVLSFEEITYVNRSVEVLMDSV